MRPECYHGYVYSWYISGVYHAITCKFQWHLCVPAWMGFAWLTLLIKTHLVMHIYCQLTVHNSTHALARLHEKCGKTLDTGTGQLRSPNSNPFLFTSATRGWSFYLFIHILNQMSATRVSIAQNMATNSIVQRSTCYKFNYFQFFRFIFKDHLNTGTMCFAISKGPSYTSKQQG